MITARRPGRGEISLAGDLHYGDLTGTTLFQLEPASRRPLAGCRDEAVAVDVDVQELQDALGHRGEVAAADLGGLAAAAAHHVGEPVDGDGAFVVVVVAGEDEVDVVALEDRFEPLIEPGCRAVPSRRVRRVVQGDDLPLAGRAGERVVEPLALRRGPGAEQARHARVEEEEVDRSVGRRVVAAGRAEQAELGLDLPQALVAVVQILVVVADGELEPDAGVDQGAIGLANTSS